MSKTALVKIPKLKAGDDKAIAAMLVKKHDLANEATKVIFDAGLLCFYIKENLAHGQFGLWLQAHCPQEMWRINSKTGNPVASSLLSQHMALTSSLVEKCGTTITKLLSQIPTSWEFATRGEFLQLAAGSDLLLKAPEKVLAVHAEASKAVEGKSAYQLFWEFKQSEEDDEGNVKVKRGRLKGKGGATKEQREAAAAREERERLESMVEKSEEVAEWLLENADPKGFGRMDEVDGGAKGIKKLADAIAYTHNFFTALKKSTK